MYYGAYTSKHNSDCEKALVETLLAIEKHEEKTLKQQEMVRQQAMEQQVNPARIQDENGEHSSKTEKTTLPRLEYSVGLGKLLSAIRASTNGDTIGGPLAAFVLLGNEIFAMSHQTAVLPLTQAIAYLEKETIYANITRYGDVKATIYDYVFRSKENPLIEKMNLWSFTQKQESCKLKARPSNCDAETDSSSEDESNSARIIHKCSPDHPQHGTEGHRERMDVRWPKYVAKRLPDLKSLEDSSDLLPDERQERREEYPKGGLTICCWRNVVGRLSTPEKDTVCRRIVQTNDRQHSKLLRKFLPFLVR
jgi:hypothetical protein